MNGPSLASGYPSQSPRMAMPARGSSRLRTARWRLRPSCRWGRKGASRRSRRERWRRPERASCSANTYHLWLRPGPEVVAGGWAARFTLAARDPHRFGRFQAFSLAERRTRSEHGFVFRSHLDGSKHLLTPEVAMRVQGLSALTLRCSSTSVLRATSPREEVELAVAQTTRWAIRCLAARRPEQALFGIVQGGAITDLASGTSKSSARSRSTGWRSAGSRWESPSGACMPSSRRSRPVPRSGRPRYLMGVGTPRDLLGGHRCRRRHVRLRPSHAQRQERAGAHPPRAHLHQAGSLQGRPGSAR